MEEARPMKKIMLIDEWEKSLMFQAACECGDEEHHLTIDISCDKDNGLLEIWFFKKLEVDAYFGTCQYDDPALERIWDKIKVLWKRVKIASRILFTGWYTLESVFLFTDPEHLNDFIKALNYGKNRIDKWQAEWKEKMGKEVKNTVI